MRMLDLCGDRDFVSKALQCTIIKISVVRRDINLCHNGVSYTWRFAQKCYSVASAAKFSAKLVG